MAGQLGCHMRSCRGIGGEIAQHGTALLHRFVLVRLSQHLLRAGLVQAGIEGEFTAMLGIVAGRHQGPSGENVGEADDVILGIAGPHAQRMQLENLAGEIFVQAAAAVEAGGRIRAHRNRLVEIEQHRRMALGRQQQVGEAAEHVRADGLALVSAGHAPDLVGRDAEMIGPEPDQPLDKTDFGAERGRDANPRLFEIDPPPRIGDSFSGHLRRHLARALRGAFHHRGRFRHLKAFRVLLFLGDDRLRLPLRKRVGHRAIGLGARRQIGGSEFAGCGTIEVSEQRAARVGLDRRDRSRTRPHSEPMEG